MRRSIVEVYTCTEFQPLGTVFSPPPSLCGEMLSPAANTDAQEFAVLIGAADL